MSVKKYVFLGLSLVFLACGNKQNGEYTESDLRMVVGTYTDSGSYGLYSFTFNETTGDFSILDSCKIENPSYLTFSEDGKNIYAVSELHSESAAVYALNFNPQNGKMEVLNYQNTVGYDPCYVSTNGNVVVTANYGGSMSVFPIESDGKLGDLSQLFEGTIGGPDTIRQNSPHVHCAEFTVDGQHLYASDFSADRLMVYKVVDEGSRIIPLVTDSNHNVAIELVPDYGPRHIVFDKTGKFGYVIGELSGTISVLEKDSAGFVVKQTIDADEVDARGSADIHISPDGKYLYASNRLKNDGIAIFKIDPSIGLLSAIGYQLTGIHPRNFEITPNGKYLLCACRDTNEIQIFLINEDTGLLTPTGTVIQLPKPVCIKFSNPQGSQK